MNTYTINFTLKDGTNDYAEIEADSLNDALKSFDIYATENNWEVIQLDTFN